MEKRPEVEKLPNIVEKTPELELAWRGLVISIKEGQLSRKKAIELLQEWAGETVEVEHQNPDIIEVDE